MVCNVKPTTMLIKIYITQQGRIASVSLLLNVQQRDLNYHNLAYLWGTLQLVCYLRMCNTAIRGRTLKWGLHDKFSKTN